MNIETIMISEVTTISVTDSLLGAGKMLKEKGFKHLPVLDEKGALVGIITDRDIKRASASDATTLEVHELLYLLDHLKIGKVMSKPPITVAPDTSVQTAAQLLLSRKIGCLPVMKDGRLVGILTNDDLVRLIADGKA